MGSSCSTGLADSSPTAGCGRLQRLGQCHEHCDPCEDDGAAAADLASEHPLLAKMQQEQDAGAATPRTPRGPAPPWVLQQEERRVDRTATGATPPRSPTPPRSLPPGLPEDDAKNSDSVVTLAGSFGADFLQDLFRTVRQGNLEELTAHLSKVNTVALSLLSSAGLGFVHPDRAGLAASERVEKAAELTAEYISKAREATSPKSTLLLAASEKGRYLVVESLLQHKADPLVADDKGNIPLHKAAQSGSLLSALLLLDRIQSNDRSANIASMVNGDGETPEILAAEVGAADVCRAFEVFQTMQRDAASWQLGSASPLSDHQGHRIATGDMLSLIDLAVEMPSAAAATAGALLRRSSVGTPLVPNIFQRVPEEQAELSEMVSRVCRGIETAESQLLHPREAWDSTDPGLDPGLRSFVATASLRSQWQKIRQEALAAVPGADSQLEDFWQTHLTAEAMANTMRQATTDTFQLLLTALWLYTREAWLRHLLDALAAAVYGVHGTHAEGDRGATGEAPVALPAEFAPVAPFVEALSPCMQLVQAALLWFEEANIRHTAVTYRPLQLPMLGLQKLVDRYVAARKAGDSVQESGRLDSGYWLSLGGGSFFSSLSSRSMAISRLAKTRCNVLVIIRPDESSPSYPKHMSLRGSNVDDSIFSLETLFRIGRITRTVSSELDVDGSAHFAGPRSRWPVIIIEVYSVSCFTEAVELLQSRQQLRPGELGMKLEEWVASAPPDREPERRLAAGQVLQKVALDMKMKGEGILKAKSTELEILMKKSGQMLSKAAESAIAAGQLETATQALLAKARIPGSNKEQDCVQAIELLKKQYGESHPQTQNAKTVAIGLGVHL